MAFTPELNLELPDNGSYEDVWDGPMNLNFQKISVAFAAEGPHDVPTGEGHCHDGTVGEGPKIRHQDLADAGSSSHGDIDAALGKVLVSAGDLVIDYLLDKLQAGAGITLTKLNPGADEKVEIDATGVTPTLGDVNDPSGEYGWKHFVPTSAPVAYTDNFNYPSGMDLVDCDYRTTFYTPGGASFEFLTSKYSARSSVNVKTGDDSVGRYAATVACHTPHGRAQRVSLSLTDLDYEGLCLGDSVTFTLAVHSTHQLGPNLPQKYGVILEISIVKTAAIPPFTYQISHKVWIIPDDANQVLLFQCSNHTSPDEILGCWEISLDSNGHVYHYYRRKLVYSSQTTPPNNTGPVLTYFSDLTTSLQAIGDEKYGAMGFGCQYGISLESLFDLEFRWLSVTANSDEYEPATCPGAVPPCGVPSIVSLPSQFLFIPSGAPGADCCDAPDSKKIGEVLQTDWLGNPTVWVTGCNVMYNDMCPEGTYKGYTVNTNWPGCFPCRFPSGTHEIIGPPDDWPKEGTAGYVLVHGVGPLPPYLLVTADTIGFKIVAATWIDAYEFLLKYEILDGYAGISVKLQISNGYDPTHSFAISDFVLIKEADPKINNIDWLDVWLKTHTVPTSGYEFDVTIHGSGFNTDAVVESSDISMEVVSSAYVSPSEMEAVIRFVFPDSRNQTYALSVRNVAQDKSVSTNIIVAYTCPTVHYVDLAPDTSVAAGKTSVIHGNFFAPNVEVTPTDPALVANFVATYVDVNTISCEFDTVGAPGQNIVFSVADPDGGAFVLAPCCVIADVSIPAITTVVTTPDVVYDANRGLKYTVRVTGTNFGASSYVLFGNLPKLEVYLSEGDIHTTARTATTIDGEFWIPCGEIVDVDVSAYKAGVGADTALNAFTVQAVPSLTLNVGDLVFDNGTEPGVTGIMTLTPTAGITHLTDLFEGNDSIALDAATRTVTPTKVTWDYEVAADAVEGAVVSFKLSNGPCDLAPASIGADIEYLSPVITSIVMLLYEDMAANKVKIYGTGFRAGADINTTGNLLLISVDTVAEQIIEATVNNLIPGAASIEVENMDGKVSGPYALTILTEPAPVFRVSSLDPTVEGTFTTVRVWGENLSPPDAVYTFTGLGGVITEILALPTYLEFTGTITAAAGNLVTMDIASTSHAYLGYEVDIVTASGGGDVLIHDIDEPTPKENQTGKTLIVTGENLDLVDSIEAEVVEPTRQALKYFPSGLDDPVKITIEEKVPSSLVLSADLREGLAYCDYSFLFYDAGMVLLATAPSIIEAQSSDDAPVISKATRDALDISIPSAGGANWIAVIKVEGTEPWLFGDMIAGTGFTVNSQTYDSGTQEWTVDGTNDPSGADWMLTIKRPAIPPEETNYRFTGGVTT